MQIAFFKHAFSAGLLAALLSMPAPTGTALASGLTGGAHGPSASAGGSNSDGGGSNGHVDRSLPGRSRSTPGTDGATASADSSGGAAPSSPRQRVLATWYGPGFYGHTTACGQTLTPKTVGLASRTLPCGTLVQISYHGRKLTAPVLDRGPFGHNDATWDLTSGAAQALEITETVRISTQIVGSLPNGPTLGEPSSGTLAGAAPRSTAAGGTTAG
jgi:rare lipoprotein A (peptidoglycan hydrolase)